MYGASDNQIAQPGSLPIIESAKMAQKSWQRKKNTIVIGHDCSPLGLQSEQVTRVILIENGLTPRALKFPYA
jgi:hypothetical protein